MSEFDLTTNTTTGEPVTEQAPTVDTLDATDQITNAGESITEQAPTVDALDTTDQITNAGEPITDQAPATLPTGYLSNGYYATTEKDKQYLRPVYVADYAEQIAAAISNSMPPKDFTSLLRGLKSAKKRTLPFEARQTAAFEMLPKALALLHRKKDPAPPLLVDFIKANLDALHNDDDWFAFYRHCEAIQGYLSLPQEKK